MNFGDKIYCSAIVVAAGKGKRMGTDINKQFINIKDKPILVYTLETFSKCDDIDEIILVVSDECIDFCKNDILYKYNIQKSIKLVSGGHERQDSVYNGLKAVSTDTDIVLVHDGVRPFVDEQSVKKIVQSSCENAGCVLAVPVKDTIKIVNSSGFIDSTPERNSLWAVQTPQGFKYNILMEAYKKAFEDKFVSTDDSALVERLGYKIKLEQGSYRNIKITTKEDLVIAESMI